MGYYVELRPRDAKPLTIAQYKDRFAKLLEKHPAATLEPDPETRKKYENDFLYSGGYISIYQTKSTPAAVTSEARLSWSCSIDEVRRLVHELREIADRVSADLYIGDERIERGNEERIIEDCGGGAKRVRSMLG